MIDGAGNGIGAGRDLWAAHARADWLASVDADTKVDPAYLDAMLGYVDGRDVAAASSRCPIPGVRWLHATSSPHRLQEPAGVDLAA